MEHAVKLIDAWQLGGRINSRFAQAMEEKNLAPPGY